MLSYRVRLLSVRIDEKLSNLETDVFLESDIWSEFALKLSRIATLESRLAVLSLSSLYEEVVF